MELQFAFQVLHVRVFKRVMHGAAQSDPINNGSMYQSVRDHNILVR